MNWEHSGKDWNYVTARAELGPVSPDTKTQNMLGRNRESSRQTIYWNRVWPRISVVIFMVPRVLGGWWASTKCVSELQRFSVTSRGLCLVDHQMEYLNRFHLDAFPVWRWGYGNNEHRMARMGERPKSIAFPHHDNLAFKGWRRIVADGFASTRCGAF